MSYFTVQYSFPGTEGNERYLGNDKTIVTVLSVSRAAVFLLLPAAQVLVPTVFTPDLPYLFTSILPHPSQTSVFIRLPIGLAQFYVSIIHFGMLAYNFSTVIMLVCLIPGIMSNMRLAISSISQLAFI